MFINDFPVKNFFRISFLAILFFFCSPFLFSQCCSHSASVSSDRNLGTLAKHEFRFTLAYLHYTSGKYYSGNSVTSFQYISKSYYDFIGINLSYGLLRRLTTDIEAGYFLKKFQQFTFGSQLQAKGISDMTVLAKYNVYKDTAREYEIVVGAGAKIPTGQNNQWVNGVKLPTSLQSGTGSYSFVSSFFIYKGFVAKHLRFFLAGRFQANGTSDITGNLGAVIDQYNYGNVYSSSFYTSYSLGHRLTALLQIRGELRNKDVLRSIGIVNSSGFKKLFITPQWIYSIAEKWNLGVSGDYPLYQYVNGTQLSSSWAASFNLSRTLDLKKKHTPPHDSPL